MDQRLALIALADKKALGARRRAEEEHEVVRLLNGCHDADSDDDGLSLSSADSVSSDAPSAVSWNNASSRVWRAEEMRPQQLKAVKILFVPRRPQPVQVLEHRLGEVREEQGCVRCRH